MSDQDLIKELAEKLSDLSHACTREGLDIPEMHVAETLDKFRKYEIMSTVQGDISEDDLRKDLLTRIKTQK